MSLLLTVATNTLRHVILFLHRSFALGRRSLIVMKMTFLILRGVEEILLIIMFHVVDKITTCILNSLLLNAHDNELLNSLVFRMRVVVNLKSLRFLGQGRHN
jgi:hypothetical protein